MRYCYRPASEGNDGGDRGIGEGLADNFRRDETSRASDNDLHDIYHLKPLMGLALAENDFEEGKAGGSLCKLTAFIFHLRRRRRQAFAKDDYSACQRQRQRQPQQGLPRLFPDMRLFGSGVVGTWDLVG